ncbi:hypothetical protein V8D89_000654 [Ganoderma adspersum]
MSSLRTYEHQVQVDSGMEKTYAKEEVTEVISNQPLQSKFLWNRSLPINQLPYELLVHIFLLVHPESDIGGPVTERADPKRNLKLMGTCRLWRDIIVETPAFWSVVSLEHSNANWTGLCLARSYPAPIKVWARVLGWRRPTLPRLLCLAYPLVHRIRTLYFSVDAISPEVDDSGPDWPFRVLFGNGVPVMPALENLDLAISHDELPRRHGHSPDDVELTRRRFPHLQSLTLAGILAPRDIALYADLRTLSLTTCSHRLSIDQFLDTLALCTRLETLYLEETLDRLADSDDWAQRDPVPRRPLIYFPRLISLELSKHGSVCTSRFLAHIHVRACVQLEIWSRDEPPFPEGDGRAPATALSIAGGILPPSYATTLAPLATVNDVEVETWPSSPASRCRQAWLSTRRDPESDGMPVRARAAGRGSVRELVDLLPAHAPVTKLTFRQLGRHPNSMTVAAWAAVFRAFPRLERLSVMTWGAPLGALGLERMFLGLHAASASMETETGAAGSLAPTPGTLACPHLREVAVCGCGSATAAACEAVRTCIGYRGARGAVLGLLDLDLYGGMGGLSRAPERSRAGFTGKESFKRALRRLVGTLSKVKLYLKAKQM